MFFLAAATAASNDPVTISTTAYAPWASDPALEAAALLSQHGNQTLRAFWEAWAAQTPTDDSSLRSSLALVEPLLPSLAYRTFKISMAARVHAPLVEMWREVADSTSDVLGASDGDACWAIACGELHASVPAAILAAQQAGCDEAAAAATASHAVLGPLPAADHVLAEAAGAPVLVYADVHARGFGACLAELSAAAHLRLRYRPAAARGVAVQGFGAELALKSDEYKTIDDRKAAAGAEEEGAEAEAEDEGEAGEQPTLLLRKRAEEPVGPEALGAERVRRLGLQAALLVLRSKRPLATLRDVAGNLPSLARPLSRVSLEGKHEEARRALEEPRRSQRLQSAQHGALTLNGLSAG